jgi:MMP 1-O-methyltransferase
MTLEELRKIDGMIAEKEANVLHRLGETVLPGEHIVEIGAWKGKSTCLMADGLIDIPDSLLFTYDLWDDAVREGASTAQAEFHGHLEQAGVTSKVIAEKRDGAHAAKEWDNGVVSVLFIDGDHTERAVLRDFRAWARHLRRGSSIVAFHDYGREQTVTSAVNLLMTQERIAPIGREQSLIVCKFLK